MWGRAAGDEFEMDVKAVDVERRNLNIINFFKFLFLLGLFVAVAIFMLLYY